MRSKQKPGFWLSVIIFAILLAPLWLTALVVSIHG